MSKIVRGLLLCTMLVAAGCGGDKPQPPVDTPDAALKKTLAAYVVEFLKRNPTTNTYLGGAALDPSLRDVDGSLRDYSTSALEGEDQWLADTAKALDAINVAQLPPGARIDRDVALAQIH